MGEEEEWLKKLSQGDSLALRPLMDAYGDVVMRTAYLLLGDRHLAEDASQEVFMTVYRKHHQLKQVSRLQAWLVGIIINRCRAWMRRSSWKRLFYREMVEDKKAAVAVVDYTIELRMELRDCLQYLSYKNREVILLHYYHDWSSSQIAEVLGISDGTVKSRLSRARQHLKAIMLERVGVVRKEENWGSRLKEEVQELKYSEELKQRVLHRVTTSWWDREITVPVSLVGGILILSLIIALSPLYGGMSKLNHMTFSSKAEVSNEQDFVNVNGIYVQRSLLIGGD